MLTDTFLACVLCPSFARLLFCLLSRLAQLSWAVFLGCRFGAWQLCLVSPALGTRTFRPPLGRSTRPLGPVCGRFGTRSPLALSPYSGAQPLLWRSTIFIFWRFAIFVALGGLWHLAALLLDQTFRHSALSGSSALHDRRLLFAWTLRQSALRRSDALAIGMVAIPALGSSRCSATPATQPPWSSKPFWRADHSTRRFPALGHCGVWPLIGCLSFALGSFGSALFGAPVVPIALALGTQSPPCLPDRSGARLVTALGYFHACPLWHVARQMWGSAVQSLVTCPIISLEVPAWIHTRVGSLDVPACLYICFVAVGYTHTHTHSLTHSHASTHSLTHSLNFK